MVERRHRRSPGAVRRWRRPGPAGAAPGWSWSWRSCVLRRPA